MAIEDLKLPLPTRQSMIDAHLRFRNAWNPGIDRSEGGEPHLDAMVSTDTFIPVVAQARRIAQAAFPSLALDEDVAYWGNIEGVDASPATGSVGLVRITASVGGGEITEEDHLIIRGRTNGPRFRCRLTGRYFANDVVPVVSIDTGVETNLEPGTELRWYQAPSGIGPRAFVVDQDGEGLTGGRDAATPEEHKRAIIDKRRDPPGASNDAHYRHEARRSGVAVQQAFSYPAILGPGTTGLALLMYPSRPGGSGAPTSQQLTIVAQHLDTAFGADDSTLLVLTLLSPTTVAFKIDWARRATGWANSSPWPVYGAAGGSAIVVTAVTSATAFTVGTANGSYSGITAPTAGKRIAVLNSDAPTGPRFEEKRILSVSGSGPWALTIDTTNSASDENYTPAVGQRVSPWSDSLGEVLTATVNAFSQLGPGEMLAHSQPDGFRRYRQPAAPAQWPYRLTQDLLEGAISPARISTVADRELVEGDGVAAPQGRPGQFVYRLTLGDLAVFPKS